MSTNNQKNGNNPKKKRKANKKGKTLLLLVELLVLVIAIGALLIVNKVLKSGDGSGGMTSIAIENVETNEGVAENFENDENLKGYTNIALFGVDARNGELQKGTRTDTIIICSINNETGDVKLISVYRDTYLNLASSGKTQYNKCNSAYAYGGPQQAIDMLNMNLDLNITDFVTVGFDGLINTIDALGGVEVDVQNAEITHLNNYQRSMYATEANPNKINENYTPVTDAGKQTLNGLQAVAYCRIRATAGDDFRRTERQRTVLQAILDKAKNASPSTISDIVDEVTPMIATSLDVNEIASMAGRVSTYNITETCGFPFSDSITTGKIGGKGSCVVPVDLVTNVTKLHATLFPEATYTPSAQITEYSNVIKSETSPYLN